MKIVGFFFDMFGATLEATNQALRQRNLFLLSMIIEFVSDYVIQLSSENNELTMF